MFGGITSMCSVKVTSIFATSFCVMIVLNLVDIPVVPTEKSHLEQHWHFPFAGEPLQGPFIWY